MIEHALMPQSYAQGSVPALSQHLCCAARQLQPLHSVFNIIKQE
jgi:hypothetical protein